MIVFGSFLCGAFLNRGIFPNTAFWSLFVALIFLCSTWQFVIRWWNQIDEVAVFRVGSLFCSFFLLAERTFSLFVLSIECIRLSLLKSPNKIVPYSNLHMICKRFSNSGKKHFVYVQSVHWTDLSILNLDEPNFNYNTFKILWIFNPLVC